VVQKPELRQPAVVSRALLGEIASAAGTTICPRRLWWIAWFASAGSCPSESGIPGSSRPPPGQVATPPGTHGSNSAPCSSMSRMRLWLWPSTPPSGSWDIRPTNRPGRSWRTGAGGVRPRRSTCGSVTFEWQAPHPDGPGTTGVARGHCGRGRGRAPGAARATGPNADDWLPETFRSRDAGRGSHRSRGRKVSTLARLGYLAEWSGRDDVADEIEALLPGRLPVTSIGPRDRRDRWSRRWHVYDALLPQR
jgi:hypothetical protein